MRLHRLRITAFGPFAGSQDVDFDDLSAAGLFLLHGPTGAGKTSVLDAVCYALYGAVPGARQQGQALRSDHADPLTPTEVVLELTVGGRRLEITRRPEQPRPKKRGAGFTRDKAQTWLRECAGGEWKALSRSHQEAGEEITQLLGMSREQFCQVVLLPQGDFARFLRADAEARGKLLGRLFDTRRFAAVEERLAELRRAAEREVGSGDDRLLALAHRMAQAAGGAEELREVAPGDPGLADAVLEWAAVARADARERRDIAALAVRAAESAHGEAQRHGEAVRELDRLQRAHRDARRRADELQATAGEMAAVRARLDRARAAAAVVPALELRDAMEREHRGAVAALRGAREALIRETAGTGGLPAPRTGGAPASPAAGATIPRPPGPDRGSGRDVVGARGDGDLWCVPDPTERPADARASAAAAGPGPHGRGGDVPADGRDGGTLAGPGRQYVPDSAEGAGAAGDEVAGPVRDSADGCVGARGTAAGALAGADAERLTAGSGLPAGPEADSADGLAGAGGGGHPARSPDAGVAAREGGDLAEAGAERLAVLERQLRQELGGLAAAQRAERKAARLAAERATLDREARADADVLQDTADWLADWETVRAAHQQRIEAAQEAATRAEQLAAQIGPALSRLDAARRRDRLAAETAGAEERWRLARDRAAQARDHWLDLKDRRLRGFAAELAARLRPGEPCEVCGAVEHPAPTRAEADHVDPAAEDAALEAYRQADAEREQADARLRELREALAAATAGAGDTATAELREEAERLQRAHAEAHAAAADMHAAREAQARAEREYERRRAQRQDAERRAAARTSHREAIAREQAELEADVARARAGAASVAERAAHLERRAALLAAAADAVRAEEATAQRLKETHARLADAAYRAGFDTPEAAAHAVLPDPERRRLQHRLDQWQAETAAVARELADPRAAAAADLPPADVAAAQAAEDAATRRLRAASAAEAEARTRCAELDRLSAQALQDARRLAPVRERYERVARLAALAAGTSAENERKMRLESYVLAARLEQVAAAASLRLQRMSAGRYTLVHSDARAGGRGRSGLGLHVIDAWTGSERDTATLSGGETFFASLSLALGLADVVTDEAGGIRLDTLFIDEGFGSLDEQTLDEVLDVLDSLRERDRTVGIVSHVADLRQRIPAQLEVVKGRAGSRIRHRTAPIPG